MICPPFVSVFLPGGGCPLGSRVGRGLQFPMAPQEQHRSPVDALFALPVLKLPCVLWYGQALSLCPARRKKLLGGDVRAFFHQAQSQDDYSFLLCGFCEDTPNCGAWHISQGKAVPGRRHTADRAVNNGQDPENSFFSAKMEINNEEHSLVWAHRPTKEEINIPM